jgi:5'-nucleotidase
LLIQIPGGELRENARALVLVTNDDGVESPGLLAAVRAVTDLAQVWAVAPLVQQSGVGRSFPRGPVNVEECQLQVDGVAVPCYALDSSPAQAVRHAVLRLLPRQPDLVISGINFGENVGGAATISGTIGAAIEAASFRIPALAASLETEREHHFTLSSEVDFDTAAVFVRRFAEWLLRHGMPRDVDILKVEVPCSATPETPWRMTRVSRQQYWISPVRLAANGEREILAYEKRIDMDTLEPDSDIYALAVDSVVAVSPLTIDLTAPVDLSELANELSSVDGSV